MSRPDIRRDAYAKMLFFYIYKAGQDGFHKERYGTL